MNGLEQCCSLAYVLGSHALWLFKETLAIVQSSLCPSVRTRQTFSMTLTQIHETKYSRVGGQRK